MSTTRGMAMSAGAGHGGTSILPEWLALVWTAVFLVLLVQHARHAIMSSGQRRWWHASHVLMALGMAFMFAPASIDPLAPSAAAWRLVFASGVAVVLMSILVQSRSGRATNPLWVLTAIDLGAMVYMWSPGGLLAPVTWVLVAYFAAHTALWATGAYRRIDAGGPSATSASVRARLVCGRSLRPYLTAMTVGMAYMLAAMQLLS